MVPWALVRIPRASVSAAPGSSGTASASSSRVAFEPCATCSAWPATPNPVTSVAAWTAACSSAGRSSRLTWRIDAIAGAMASASISSFLRAPASVPVPTALVNTRTSPGRAPEFFHSRSGWAKPVTEKPSLRVSSSIEWPPTRWAPAASIVSSAPAISVREHLRRERASSGNARMVSAVTGVPPMA